MELKKIVFATGNKGKVKEIQMILADLGVEVTTMKEEGIFVDVEETKENFAIPSAFVKYTEYLNLTIGRESIESKKGL